VQVYVYITVQREKNRTVFAGRACRCYSQPPPLHCTPHQCRRVYNICATTTTTTYILYTQTYIHVYNIRMLRHARTHIYACVLYKLPRRLFSIYALTTKPFEKNTKKNNTFIFIYFIFLRRDVVFFLLPFVRGVYGPTILALKPICVFGFRY